MRIEKSFFLFPSSYFSAFLPLRPPFLFRVYLPFRSYLFPFCPLLLIFSFQPQRTLFTNACFYSKNVLLLSLFLPLKTLKKSSFLLLFPLLLPRNSSSIATPKGLCFRLLCCDNLIKWNIKCVIFWVRKRGEKGGGTLQYR